MGCVFPLEKCQVCKVNFAKTMIPDLGGDDLIIVCYDCLRKIEEYEANRKKELEK